MEQEHVFELIPGYVLDALDKNEKQQVVEHLEVCDRCQIELQSYKQVVDDLPLAAKIVQPPANLKTKIMARVKDERKPVDAIHQTSLWDRFRQALLGTAPVWGAASLALVLVLFVSNLFLWQRIDHLESASQQALITVALRGTDITPDASGIIVMSNDGDYGVLVVDGLPELGNAQQYQLWLIQDGQRTSGGIFSVNDEGYGSVLVSSPQPLISYADFGITVEPAGGSPGPTGDKVLGGSL